MYENNKDTIYDTNPAVFIFISMCVIASIVLLQEHRIAF